MPDTLVVDSFYISKLDKELVVSVELVDGRSVEVFRGNAEGPIQYCVHASGVEAIANKDPGVFTMIRSPQVTQ